jgi:hypothetical protein
MIEVDDVDVRVARKKMADKRRSDEAGSASHQDILGAKFLQRGGSSSLIRWQRSFGGGTASDERRMPILRNISDVAGHFLRSAAFCSI